MATSSVSGLGSVSTSRFYFPKMITAGNIGLWAAVSGALFSGTVKAAVKLNAEGRCAIAYGIGLTGCVLTATALLFSSTAIIVAMDEVVEGRGQKTNTNGTHNGNNDVCAPSST